MKKTYFITGGTGSFAKKFVGLLIKKLQKRLLYLAETNINNQ